MGTTRIKVIDLSSGEKEIKTSRKHAEKLAGVAKLDQKTQKVSKSEKSESQIVRESDQEKTPEKSETPTARPSEPSESSESSEPSPKAKPKKAKIKATIQKHHLGKKYKAAKEQIDTTKSYPTKEAFVLLSKTSYTKFDPTVEIHLNVSDKKIRGNVKFPHPVGGKKKEKKYLIFSDKQSTINDQHIIRGDEKTIDQIAKGEIKPNRDFDTVIASPKFMPKLATVAKILGPAGMMPNPKNGTILDDPTKALEKQDEDTTEFRTDPTAAIIHQKLGKLSAKPDALEENLKALVLAVGPTKIRKATLTSTMGPGIKIDLLA